MLLLGFPSYGSGELRAHEIGISCNDIADQEKNLGGIATEIENHPSEKLSFHIVDAGMRAGVIYTCKNGEILESHQMFLPETFDDGIKLFDFKMEILKRRFGQPCHDYRIAPMSYIKKKWDSGEDIEGLIKVDWHLQDNIELTDVLTLSMSGMDKSIGYWMVLVAVTSGGFEVIQSDGSKQRHPPSLCDSESK